MSKRECGECMLCCKLLGVEELKKPSNEWCQFCSVEHLRGHRIPLEGGCKIYEERPTSCQEFECLWLQGIIPEDLFPRTSRVVFSTTASGDEIVAYVSPEQEAYLDLPVVHKFISSCVDRGRVVFVVCGERRKLLYRGTKIPAHIKLALENLKS